MKCKFLAILMVCSLVSFVSAVELDSKGCRVLSKCPEPGIHPRVFFTADEYPLMKQRLNEAKFKKHINRIQEQAINYVNKEWSDFAKKDMSSPTDEEIKKYFTSAESRNINWAVVSVTSVLEDDDELRNLMKNVIVNYAHIILTSKKRHDEGALKFKIWKHDRWDVGVGWTFGAAGYTVSYDVLYNYMTKAERRIVSSAIAAATKGRKSYGNGMARGFATSNHYGYHGDLAVMLSVIEGEKGFDQETWNGICKVMKDYWEIGFTQFGYSREDGYGPNLGMRGGGRGYMVLARRGYNIFATEKYRKFMNYVAMDYDPYPGGHLNGGASGGPYEELYPTSTLMMRYMYPENVVANFNYRHMCGDDFQRRLRWQGFLDYLLYGSDWKGPESREDMLKKSGLPLTMYYPVRGKFIARSGWSDDAMYVTFDARPDAHLIGHDKVDRGNFSMSALGRIWAFSGDFHHFDKSTENSLVHIDGKAQAWKAPSVRFMWTDIKKDIAGAGADLKYAYDWQWTPPWPKWGKKYNAPWSPETISPMKLGWPEEYKVDEICPDSIHGSETGYAGRNNLHKQPYNKVEKAKRSIYLVRDEHPYVVICDDIKKDDQEHLYEWYMQLPLDLELKDVCRNHVILQEKDGARKMLVQFLQDDEVSVKVEKYRATKDKKGNVTEGQRLIASLKTIEPKFRVMLCPYTGSEVPGAVSGKRKEKPTFTLGKHKGVLTFSTSDAEGTKISLE